MLDWLLPPQCAGCGQNGARWCKACIERCLLVQDDVCSLCGQQNLVQGKVHHCLRRNDLDSAFAWGKYQDPLRKAIRRLKYSRDIGLGESLAYHLVELVEKHQISVEMVVPVPLARKRQQERGYNQAALLARSTAFILGLALQLKAVKRIRETVSQVGLSLEERRRNVAGAFLADADRVSGKSILLVDDVLTTGSTLEATAQALRQAGAKRIDAVVVSRA